MRIVIGRASTAAAALLAAAVLAAPQAVSAQSLGEAAERAKKERKGGSKTKVITDTELRQAGGTRYEPPVTSSEPESAAAPADGTAPAPADGAAPAPADGTAPATTDSAPRDRQAKTEDELRAEAEVKWRERLQQSRNDVSRLSAEANQLQTGLNDMTQNLYGANRTNAMNRLEEVKKQLAAAQTSVVDLEEEGRRSRFRP